MCVVSVHHRQGNWSCCPTSTYSQFNPRYDLGLGSADLDCHLEAIHHDFCKASLPAEAHPGPQAALSRSEVLTLAICGQ